ncbi:Hypothetical predicted protein [Pelobates cultripes]|uniref:Reverse transcriptase domain-containing protein n=1 Tax=Pelobates cultripes TaxID=61616 RepID=A0AAD1S0C8_PELCU|nr:Hypothetical predicted protein [Pelobates cultripes]
MGFPAPFCTAIKALYTDLRAQTLNTGVPKTPVPLSRGTRQGYSFSPLLFAVNLEPLLLAIRSDPEIRGIELAHKPFRVSVYVNNVLLTLADPVRSLPLGQRV